MKNEEKNFYETFSSASCSGIDLLPVEFNVQIFGNCSILIIKSNTIFQLKLKKIFQMFYLTIDSPM
jgi:hypothetical protein